MSRKLWARSDGAAEMDLGRGDLKLVQRELICDLRELGLHGGCQAGHAMLALMIEFFYITAY
jgi:hypothetical protein